MFGLTTCYQFLLRLIFNTKTVFLILNMNTYVCRCFDRLKIHWILTVNDFLVIRHFNRQKVFAIAHFSSNTYKKKLNKKRRSLQRMVFMLSYRFIFIFFVLHDIYSCTLYLVNIMMIIWYNILITCSYGASYKITCNFTYLTIIAHNKTESWWLSDLLFVIALLCDIYILNNQWMKTWKGKTSKLHNYVWFYMWFNTT